MGAIIIKIIYQNWNNPELWHLQPYCIKTMFSIWRRKIRQGHQSRDMRVTILQDGWFRLSHKFSYIDTFLETEFKIHLDN